MYAEYCLEGEIRLNNLYSPSTIEDYYTRPLQFKDLLIKDELPRGKVEMCVNGEWGTVCEGETWSNLAASVACHQLGFSRLGIQILIRNLCLITILLPLKLN